MTVSRNHSVKDFENTKPDVLIIGSGIGGLLVGSLLAKRGKKVVITEKLSRLGGRFTARPIQGHEVPTGALHLIPHGKRGPLGQILRKHLKIPLKIHTLHYFSSWKWKGESKERRHQLYQAIFLMMPKNHDKLTLIKLMKDVPRRHLLNLSFEEYLENLRVSSSVKGFFSAIIGFSMGLENHQITTGEVFEFFNSLFKYGRPGIPEGGLRNLINHLSKFIRDHGGLILTNAKVIELDNSRSKNKIDSVTIKTRNTNEDYITLTPKVVVSNIGLMNTLNVLTDIPSSTLLKKSRIPVATGAKFVYSTSKPILGHSGVTFYPENKYVKGSAEPTHLVPSLAPNKRHLFISYVTFQERSTLSYRQQLSRAREELLNTHPELEKWGEELSIQMYDEKWPVNWARQGIHVKPKLKFIDNLWFVGDGFKRPGLIMSEGIAAVAQEVANEVVSFNSGSP